MPIYKLNQNSVARPVSYWRVWASGASKPSPQRSPFVFAVGSRDTFDSRDLEFSGTQDFLPHYPGDYRIANTFNPNMAMAEGASDMAGNDPSVVRRYAELIAFAQGKDVD